MQLQEALALSPYEIAGAVANGYKFGIRRNEWNGVPLRDFDSWYLLITRVGVPPGASRPMVRWRGPLGPILAAINGDVTPFRRFQDAINGEEIPYDMAVLPPTQEFAQLPATRDAWEPVTSENALSWDALQAVREGEE